MSIKILKDIIYTKCLYASYVCSNIDNIKDFDKLLETKEELDKIYQQVKDNIPYDEIKKYILIKENLTTILNICKKNMMILIFCMYNMNVKKDFETKTIKYIHNQEDKVIFNSEMISKINEYSKIIKNFYDMYEKDKKENKKENIDNIIEYGLSKKIIYNVLDLNEKDVSKNLKLFSIIRYILTIKEYNYDKIPIIKIINHELFKNTETTFLNLYYSTEENINIDTIESLFNPTQNKQGYANIVYELLKQNKKFKINDIKEDINKLISSNIVYPITEEFLLSHNFNEKYGTQQQQQKEDLKEINNTKFDYIFNKINNAIKNPIQGSKDESITINTYENIKLLNKMEKSLNNPKIMNNYNILKHYEENVYVNYNEFIHSGFSYTLKNNCSSVRSASFNAGKIKNLYIRNCGAGEVINIIGFVLSNDDGIFDLSVDELLDNNVSLSEFTTNIYNKLNNKKYNCCYYLFDNDNKEDEDTLSEDIEKIIKGGKSKKKGGKDNSKLKSNLNIKDNNKKDTKDEEENKIKFSDKYCINLTSKLYNNIINILNDIILMNFLKVSKEEKEFDYKKGKQIIENIINYNLLDIIENNPKIKLDLIYKSSLSLNLKQDNKDKEKENKFKLYGYDENAVKLKDIKIKKKKEILNIDLSKKKSSIENYDEDKVKSICQHYIDLNELMLSKSNKDVLKFNSLLYNFGVKYVKVNQYGNKFCKSCGEELNLGNFLESGSYNSDKQFVVQESFIITHLEDLDEYKQFGGNDGVINGLDNLLNKIASICDLNYLIGTKTKPRSARRELTKNIIDLLIENNKLLKNRYQERNKKADEKYNINRKLSCLYVFELTNDVFKNLSDSKDFYKQNKFNNMIIFSLIMIALDMDLSNIMNLSQSNNKLIDFKTYKEMVNKRLFRDLKLNTGNNIVDITKITLFSYIIYVLSMQLSKYSLYIINDEEKTKYIKKLKFNPIIQDKIINSFVDIFNSIMENYLYIKNNKEKFTTSLFQTYDIITMKFFTKLNEIYTNKNIIDKFKEKVVKTVKLEDKVLPEEKLGEYKEYYKEEDENIKNMINTKNIIYYNDKLLKSIDYGELTYNKSLICEDGKIHEWEKDKSKLNYDGKDVKCIKCGKKLSEIFNKKEYDNKLFDNYTNQKVNNIGIKYCPSGTPHMYKFKGDKEVCELCGYIKGDKIKNENIKKIQETFYKYILINNNYDITKLKTEDIYNKLKDKYIKDVKTNPFDLLSKYLLEKIGPKINIDNDEFYINNNIYIFDHNNIGYNLKENLEISEDKIKFIKNHQFYKEDVYYYITTNKIEVYYSYITNKLLGYKEQNKNYINLQSQNNYYAKIKYSLITKLKYIFFKKFFTTINENTNIYDIIYEAFITSFKFINELLTFIFMINNKKKFIETKETKTIEKEMEDLINAENKQNVITYNKLEIEKYYSNNYNIDTKDIFNNWNDILYSIMDNIENDDKITSLNNNSVIDNYNILNQYNFFNYLCYYIISEIINVDKKHNVITFILDYINNFFTNNSIQPYLNLTDYIVFLGKINCSDLELDKILNVDEEELEKAKKQMENIVEGTDDGKDEENDGYNLYQDGDEDSDDDMLDGDINGLNREPGYFDLTYRNIIV